jgi:type I restriction enzyme S subunit
MRDGEKFRLGDLCHIVKGDTPIKQAVPGRYPLVATSAERSSHEKFQFDCRAVIVPLVSSTGHGHASIKRINYQEGKFALGSILCAVIPKNEQRLSAKFLHVYFSYFKDQLIVPLMKGSANVSLSVSALAELKIILPPMDVQKHVVGLAENDSLMKPLEHEITHQETLLAKLKQTILQEAIAGKLTADWRTSHPDVEPASQLLQRIQAEKARLIAAKKLRPEKPLPKITSAEIPFEIPKGWEWARLGNIIGNTDSGWSPACLKNEAPLGKWGVLKTTAVQIREYVERENKELPPTLKPRPEAETKRGDILMTRAGPANRVGICCLVRNTRPMLMISDKLVRFRPILANPEYIELFIATPQFQMLIEACKQGMAQSQVNISRENLTSTLLPIPPLDEQAAIVKRVDALMEHCRALADEIEQTRTHAAHLLQAVLKEAFAPASM